jgi:Ca2+-binding RTX toxin-like protein
MAIPTPGNDNLIGDENIDIGIIDDVFDGSAGNDTIDGLTGSDTVDYSSFDGAVTIKPQGVVTKEGDFTDQLRNIESITGNRNKINTVDASTATSGALNVDLSSSVNNLTISGIPGSTTPLVFSIENFTNVNGGKNNDTIKGNSSDNVFGGSAGNDVIDGQGGKDTINYSSFDGAVTLKPQGVVAKEGGFTDQLIKMETIVGNAAKTNAVDASTASSGFINIDLSASTDNLKVTGITGVPDQVFSVQNFADATGTDRNDVITGNNGNNTLIGGAGDDNIGGLGGNDLIKGLSGSDTLRGDAGVDSVFGGSENDFLFGGQGNDILSGGSEADSLTGDAGNDALYGGSGADVLTGTNATSRGVGEVDFLSGGTGADSFVLGDTSGSYYLGNSANDFVRISDFSSIDKIALGTLQANQVYQVQSIADGFNLFVRDKTAPASSRDLIANVRRNTTGFNKNAPDAVADPTDSIESTKELQSDFTIPVVNIKNFNDGSIQKFVLDDGGIVDQPTQVDNLNNFDPFTPGLQEFTLTPGQTFGNFVSVV